MMLCSIFNLPSAVRSLIQLLFKTPLVLNVDAELAVVIPHRDYRVLGIDFDHRLEKSARRSARGS